VEGEGIGDWRGIFLVLGVLLILGILLYPGIIGSRTSGKEQDAKDRQGREPPGGGEFT
jgi:hypothetical protein